MPCRFILLNLIGRTMFGEDTNNEVSLYDFLCFHINPSFLAQISSSVPYLQITQRMLEPGLTQRKYPWLRAVRAGPWSYSQLRDGGA